MNKREKEKLEKIFRVYFKEIHKIRSSISMRLFLPLIIPKKESG